MSDGDGLYLRVGVCLGIIPAIAAFLGSWWYCATTYGYLLGFGLGWLPSIILAAIVFFAFMFLWGPIALLIVFLVYLGYSNDRESSARRSDNIETAATASPPAAQEEDGPWNNYYREEAGLEGNINPNPMARAPLSPTLSQQPMTLSQRPWLNGKGRFGQ